MAGLTSEGFTADTLANIKARIEGRLKAYDSEIDLDPASPDGQNVSIFGFEVSALWQQLGMVYNSFNPNITSGQGLRNLGLITGIPYGAASRSVVHVFLDGVEGTVVPSGSVVTDAAGNEFKTSFNTTIGSVPTSVEAVATQAGIIPVPIGSVTTIKTVIAGWTAVTQPAEGVAGVLPQSPQQYRNLRNKTVMRNSQSIADVVASRLYELGLEQAAVINNDHPTDTLADGTPPQTLHIVVGEYSGVTDEEIALAILNTKGLGCPTWSQSNFFVSVDDDQGVSHDVYFDKAVEVPIVVDMDLTFLDADFAGAEEDIKQAVADDINSYLSGEDVIWSRLFGLITPYGKAQVNTLTIGKTIPGLAAANVVLTTYEYSSCATTDINITVT